MLNQEVNISKLSKKELKLFLRDQMIEDIEVLLTPYRNKDIGIRILGEKTEISEKTLRRVINKVTAPHQSTAARFYRHFFEINGSSDNLSSIHYQIKRDLLGNPAAPGTVYNHKLERTLENNRVFREIFLYSRTGKITKNFVKEEFGKYGIEMIELMLAENVIIEEEKGIYSAGALSVSKTNKSIKTIVHELIEDNLDHELLSELGNNKAFYYMEGLSEKSKQEVLKISDEYQEKLRDYFFKKAELGPHRVFVASAVDELKRKVNMTSTDRRILQ